MKKQLIYSLVIAAAILAGTTGVIIANNTNANSTEKAIGMVTSDDNSGLNNNIKSLDKNETVYAITDAEGAIKSTFIGSSLYAGDENLPFNLQVNYYLDGVETAASEMAGKSGYVKIVYSYEATSFYQGKKVPFIAVTGLSLDGTKFSNVKSINGKIVSEGENYLIAGYSLVGMNSDLGVDFLPEEFIIEADVNGFELETVYTVLMNDVIADIDTSKLSDLDGLINSMNQLSDGVNQIIAGSSALSGGIEQLKAGAQELHAGAKTLAGGISSTTGGAKELAEGLTTITSYNETLQGGATQIITSTLTDLNTNIASNPELSAAIAYYGIDFPITVENYSTSIPAIYNLAPLSSLLNAQGLLDFTTGVMGYTNGVAEAAAGAEELAAGLATMDNRVPELVNGLGSLVEGTTELYNGSVKLNEGLTTFKTSGIDRLVAFANGDLTSFTYNARRTVAAARSYQNFGDSNAESVKFIVKTAGIR